MDRGIWAIWYDLPEQGKAEYLSWLNEVHLPEKLSRPGYLWAAHVECVNTPEREASIHRVLTHIDDPGMDNPGVPDGNQYLLLFGGVSPHVFVNPTPEELAARWSPQTKEMIGRRANSRYCIFVEEERVRGPEYHTRAPGITPGPIIQLGSFNINALENESEMGAWYARSRLPLMAPMTGCVGARKLVSIVGWAKHAILYEFVSMAVLEQHFVDTDQEFSRRVVTNLIHAPHSPSLGSRIWPPAP
ncbi:MAG: hypothetical protein ACE5Q6_21320 [Dehalococcoidia bacterium]